MSLVIVSNGLLTAIFAVADIIAFLATVRDLFISSRVIFAHFYIMNFAGQELSSQ